MKQAASSILFRIGSMFAVLAFASIIIFSIALSLPKGKQEIGYFEQKSLDLSRSNMSSGDSNTEVWYKLTPTIAISFLSLVVSSIGTAFTIFLGWRTDRRLAKESNLKIEQLEIQLAEARSRRPDREAPT